MRSRNLNLSFIFSDCSFIDAPGESSEEVAGGHVSAAVGKEQEDAGFPGRAGLATGISEDSY